MSAIANYYHNALSNPIIWLLVAVIVADILLGNVMAWSTGQFTSKKGVAGFIKHFSILVVTLLITPIMTAVLGSNGIPISICIYLIYLYAISILETLGKMGVPIPSSIKDRLTQVVESEIKVKVDDENINLKVEKVVDPEGNPKKEENK